MNNIALWANLTNYFTFCCILFYIINTNQQTKLLFASLILIGNFLFVLGWLFVVIRYKRKVLVEKIIKVSRNIRNSNFANKMVRLGSQIRESLSRQNSSSLVQAIRRRLKGNKTNSLNPSFRRGSSLVRDAKEERRDEIRRRSIHSMTLNEHHKSAAFMKLTDELSE